VTVIDDKRFTERWNALRHAPSVAAEFGISPGFARWTAWRLRNQGFPCDILQEKHEPDAKAGGYLRRWRRQVCASQAEVARRAGMGQQKLSRLELGQRGLSTKDYRAIGQALLDIEQNIPPRADNADEEGKAGQRDP
jgi:hypothetical protein